MKLRQDQTIELYAKLELRIKNVQIRNVVYLMSIGWQFCKQLVLHGGPWTRKFAFYLINPSWLGLFKLKVKPGTANRLIKWWLEVDRTVGLTTYYQLRADREI